MEIIRITNDLASAVSHIYALSWKTGYKNIIPQDYLDNLSMERWTPFLKNSLFDGFVLKVKGEYVATSSISSARDEDMRGWGEVVSLYVLPNHFYKGYGKLLLSFVVSELKNQGYNNIYLWVLEDNKQAINFYERNGFSTNGDKKVITIAGTELMELKYILD